MSMVRLFEERLDINRRNAIWRVVRFISLSIGFIAIISCAVIFFPYHTSFREEIPLLHGNLTEVTKVSKVNADIFVDKDDFIKVMKDKVFVSLNGNTITYMTEFDGMSYCYEDITPVEFRYHNIKSQRIQGGFVVREMKLCKSCTMFFQINIPLLALIILFWLIYNEQRNGSKTVCLG